MCGIAGILNLTTRQAIDDQIIRRMLAIIRHRGPDQFGIYLDDRVALGSARLSIIDLAGGAQPITNEDGSLWIVFNGEIFNYLELREELERSGHLFATNTDTEVILHLYEESGPDSLYKMNGQFALAMWDAKERTLFLARDRLGVRPLFYTLAGGKLIFASEIKALCVHPEVCAAIDPHGLNQIFTFWSTLSPRTAFMDIWELPPAHCILIKDSRLELRQYWQLRFPRQSDLVRPGKSRLEGYLEEFRELLVSAVRLRLRADVPVGAYLSGGLDSSTIAALIRHHTTNRLDTFSIAFSDAEFDESAYQQRMARLLGTDHQVLLATPEEIGNVFPEVIWHTETPILRTSPAPLYLLSRLVRDNPYKVVLTGEGADEFLAGYNIFKEALIRRFWARQPGSRLRPRLLRRLYPYIEELSRGSQAYLESFFGQGLLESGAADFSHAIRWKNTSRTKRFFSDDLRALQAQLPDARAQVYYPPEFSGWHPLHQAQYLEITIFLSQYLLSSQGDRVAMAHSVEGRFPFLDERVVEFCNQLPPDLKLRGLEEKYLLKRLARQYLPEEIWKRPKRPYRAPIQRAFFNPIAEEYLGQVLSPQALTRAGLFKPGAVAQLLARGKEGRNLGETDEMALVGIISTQLLYHRFIEQFAAAPPLDAALVRLIDQRSKAADRHPQHRRPGARLNPNLIRSSRCQTN